jgi:hypothetical protein
MRMPNRIDIARTAIVALIALAVPATAHASWVKISGSSTLDLRADREIDTVAAPLEVDPQMTLHGRASVVEVREGFDVREDLREAFAARIVTRESGASSLALTVPIAKLQKPTSLSVTIAVSGAPKKGASRLAELRIELIRPSAELKATSTLMIERTLWFRGLEIESADLRVEETSGKSFIRALSLEPDEGPTHAELPVRGVKIEARPIRVPAGKALSIPFELIGDPPCGVTKGTIALRADELSRSVRVAYEIHTRFHQLFIGGAALLGLLIGFLSRTYLKELVERDQRKLVALQLRSRIESSRANAKDSDYQKELDEAIAIIIAADRAKTSAEVDKGVTDAETKYKHALETFAKNRDEVLARLRERISAWSIPRDLAANARALVEGQSKRLSAIADDIGSTTPSMTLDAARRDLDLIETTLKTSLMTLLSQTSSVIAALEDLAARAPISRDEAEQIARTVDDARHAYTGLTAPAQAAIEVLDRSQAARQKLEAALDAVCLSAFVAASTTLDQVPRGADAERAAVAKDIAIVGELRTEALRSPDQIALNLGPALDRLETDLKAFLNVAGKSPSDSSKDLKKRLADEIAAKNYPRAARAIFEEIEKRAREAGEVLGFMDAVSAAPARLMSFLLSSPLRTPETPWVASEVHLVSRMEIPLSVERIRAKTFGELFRAKLAQWLLSALLTAGAAVLLFGPTFVGTPADFGGIFFWAFGMDVGVDTLLEVVKPLKKA